ncbi:MAG: hypothetical protein IKR19_07725 [Acholeplasmatales bacterium]|nr:hypothetical protein [Acholeplasmatales bacterium]
MNKSYQSYIEKRTIDRAMTARAEDARVFCVPIAIEDSIKDCCGKKYINPAAMASILGCDMFELMSALEQHKRAIGELLLDGNYGNANYEVHASDKVYLQGWINFLGLDCFSDSREAVAVVAALKETV